MTQIQIQTQNTVPQGEKTPQVEDNTETDECFDINYFEFDYELDPFLERSYTFENLYPGFLGDRYSEVYEFIKHDIIKCSDEDQYTINKELHIPQGILEYIVDVLSIFYSKTDIDIELIQCLYLYLLDNTSVEYDIS